MHLLLITFGFLPWGGPISLRASRLYRYGRERGWKVTVLCASTGCAHVVDDLSEEVLWDESDCIRVSDGTDYRWRSFIAQSIGHSPARLMDRLLGAGVSTWGRRAEETARQQIEDVPDWIVSTSPPLESACVAGRLAKHWDRPLIVDFRDPPWEDVKDRSTFESLLRLANRVSLNSPTATSYAADTWSDFRGKLVTSSNGIDEYRMIRPSSRDRKHAIVYAGGLYPSAVPVIMSLAEQIPVDVYTFLEPKRRREIRMLKRHPQVTVRPAVPESEYARLLSQYAAVMIEHPENYRYRIPVKTYSAVLSGRPLIMTGQTFSTQQLLQGMAGVFFIPRVDSMDSETDSMDSKTLSREQLDEIESWDPELHWPSRESWLRDHCWDRQFDLMFEGMGIEGMGIQSQNPGGISRN